MNEKHSNGFSLIEILITISILGIISAIGLLSFSRTTSNAVSMQYILEVKGIFDKANSWIDQYEAIRINIADNGFTFTIYGMPDAGNAGAVELASYQLEPSSYNGCSVSVILVGVGSVAFPLDFYFLASGINDLPGGKTTLQKVNINTDNTNVESYQLKITNSSSGTNKSFTISAFTGVISE